MNDTLNNSRRPRSLYKAIGVAVAAAILATSMTACKTMENLSEKDKVWVAAGVGILAAIVGNAAQKEKAGSAPAEAQTASKDSILDEVKRKVAGGADVQALRTEMLESVHFNCLPSIKAARYLLETGTPPSREESSKWLVAVMGTQSQTYGERQELAKFLIAKGADVNFRASEDEDTPMSALLWAMENCVHTEYAGQFDDAATGEESEPLFMLLVENGVNLNEVHANGYRGAVVNALGAALLNHSEQAAMRVLEKGASVNAGDWTPLMCAASRGNANMVRLLIKKGAKVNAYYDTYYGDRLTALSLAESDEIIKILKAAGAKEQSKKKITKKNTKKRK